MLKHKNLILFIENNVASDSLLKFLGIAYLITRFIKGDISWPESAGIHNYGSWCVAAMIICCAGLAVQLYKNQIMKGTMLVMALFFMTGSMIYLVDITQLTYYYDRYVLVIFLIYLFIVGIITTFCSSAGFIGVISDDKKTIKKASLMMLFLMLVCALGVAHILCHESPFVVFYLSMLFSAWMLLSEFVIDKTRIETKRTLVFPQLNALNFALEFCFMISISAVASISLIVQLIQSHLYLSTPSPFLLFSYCAFLSYLVMIIQLYRKHIISRLVLGLSLYASLGAFLFLSDNHTIFCDYDTGNYTLFYYYNTYNHVIPFIFIIIIGLLTTFLTRAGFVGVVSNEKGEVRRASLKLLGATILGAILSCYIPAFIPLIFLFLYAKKHTIVFAIHDMNEMKS